MKYLRSLLNSGWRIMLALAGLLNIIFFFTLPYAKLGGIMSSISGMMGGGSSDISLSGIGIISSVSDINSTLSQMNVGSYGTIFAILAIIPLILSIGLILVSFFLEGRKCYNGALAISIIHLISYGAIIAVLIILSAAMSSTSILGISIISLDVNVFTEILVCSLATFQIVISVLGKKRGETLAFGRKLSAKLFKTQQGGQNRTRGSNYNTDRGTNSNINRGSNYNTNRGMNSGMNNVRRNGTVTGMQGPYRNAVLPVACGSNIIIGRDPSISHIIVNNGRVSRKHCMIAYEQETGMYIVTDCSTNGTFDSAGRRLPQNRPVRMRPGSMIKIGEHGDVFRLG